MPNHPDAYYAGYRATIDHARRTALAFREAYNRAVETGEPFDPIPFAEWRTRLVSAPSKDRTPKN